MCSNGAGVSYPLPSLKEATVVKIAHEVSGAKDTQILITVYRPQPSPRSLMQYRYVARVLRPTSAAYVALESTGFYFLTVYLQEGFHNTYATVPDGETMTCDAFYDRVCTLLPHTLPRLDDLAGTICWRNTLTTVDCTFRHGIVDNKLVVLQNHEVLVGENLDVQGGRLSKKGLGGRAPRLLVSPSGNRALVVARHLLLEMRWCSGSSSSDEGEWVCTGRVYNDGPALFSIVHEQEHEQDCPQVVDAVRFVERKNQPAGTIVGLMGVTCPGTSEWISTSGSVSLMWETAKADTSVYAADARLLYTSLCGTTDARNSGAAFTFPCVTLADDGTLLLFEAEPFAVVDGIRHPEPLVLQPEIPPLLMYPAWLRHLAVLLSGGHDREEKMEEEEDFTIGEAVGRSVQDIVRGDRRCLEEAPPAGLSAAQEGSSFEETLRGLMFCALRAMVVPEEYAPAHLVAGIIEKKVGVTAEAKRIEACVQRLWPLLLTFRLWGFSSRRKHMFPSLYAVCVRTLATLQLAHSGERTLKDHDRCTKECQSKSTTEIKSTHPVLDRITLCLIGMHTFLGCFLGYVWAFHDHPPDDFTHAVEIHLATGFLVPPSTEATSPPQPLSLPSTSALPTEDPLSISSLPTEDPHLTEAMTCIYSLPTPERYLTGLRGLYDAFMPMLQPVPLQTQVVELIGRLSRLKQNQAPAGSPPPLKTNGELGRHRKSRRPVPLPSATDHHHLLRGVVSSDDLVCQAAWARLLESRFRQAQHAPPVIGHCRAGLRVCANRVILAGETWLRVHCLGGCRIFYHSECITRSPPNEATRQWWRRASSAPPSAAGLLPPVADVPCPTPGCLHNVASMTFDRRGTGSTISVSVPAVAPSLLPVPLRRTPSPRAAPRSETVSSDEVLPSPSPFPLASSSSFAATSPSPTFHPEERKRGPALKEQEDRSPARATGDAFRDCIPLRKHKIPVRAPSLSFDRSPPASLVARSRRRVLSLAEFKALASAPPGGPTL